MNKYIIWAVFASLLLGFSRTDWEPDPLCPYPSDDVTAYPYPGNCSVYWACYQGSKFLVECDTGLEFNQNAGNCSSPDVANCDINASTSTLVHTTTTESTTPSTTPESTTTTTSESTTTTSESTSPSTTTTPPSTTTEGTTTSESTSPSTTTTPPSTTTKDTTTSENTSLSTTTTTPSTTTEGTTTSHGPEPDCPNTGELIYIPYEGDCSKYWTCFEGQIFLYNCPDGLWWNPEITDCDYPGDFCDNSTSISTEGTTTTSPVTTTTRGTTTTTTSGPEPICPYPSDELITYIPYEGDCNKYWECYNGEAYLYSCPGDLWWNPEITECDKPGDYCGSATDTSPGTTATATESLSTSSTAPPDIVCPDPNDEPVYYPYPDDCTKYWECFEGVIILNTCSSGLWWNSQTEKCDTSSDYCTDGTGSGTTTESSESFTCPNPNDVPVYAKYSGDCTKYWECFEGVKYLNSCPTGLWWNDENESCENPGDFCQS